MTSLACVLALLGTVALPGVADAAGTAAVTITPATTTSPSGANVTYTLSVTCSVTGGCTNTTVSFPSTAITGDGDTTDFGSWVGDSSCASVSKTAAGGLVTFTYGNIATGSMQCTFTVKAPDYTTLNNAQVTITPTISGDNFTSSTAAPATLTLTAGHDASLGAGVAPTRVGPGQSFTFTMGFNCGTTGTAASTGDLGLSAISITDALPANFTYVSATSQVPLPGTLSFDAGSNTLTYTDTTGTSCGNAPTGLPRLIFTITGTASSGGTPDAVGTQVCHQPTSTFTYLDGATDDSTPARACALVVDLATTATKGTANLTLTDRGQYVFSGDGQPYPYTFPGDWDQSGASIGYTLQVANTVGLTQAGIAYDIQDPLPCLDHLSGGIYSSPTPGAPYCAHPAFVPTGKITVTGFSPTAADAMEVHFADGTSTSVPFAAGGWAVPSSPAIAEIDFPTFPEEGDNNFVNITFSMSGYAADNVPPDSLLHNTMTSTAFSVDGSSQIDAHQAGIDVLVADPTSPSGTAVHPSLNASAGSAGSCTESVALNNGTLLRNRIEMTSVPSQEIDVDLLLPLGATVAPSDFTSKFVEPFTLTGTNGKVFTTSAAITPAVVDDFDGTGRALIEWVIPAGLVTVPGTYQISGAVTALPVQLPAGCAGTYHNDLTIGYGAPVASCVFENTSTSHAQVPPMNPAGDSDLDFNSIGSDNYCGYSSNVVVAAINPGFSVDKTAQGNLDATPVSSGGVGNVSPTGGTATYVVSFTNTGQANLTDPVLYDLLPRVGDTDASATTSRGSQFPVTLTGLGTVPAGVTVSYSTATNPCRPEVLASNPGCTDDWSTTAPSPLSSTTALEFSYDGILEVTAGTGPHSFSVPYTVTTPAVAGGQIAWNTVGATALAGDDPMPAAESSKTGLQAESGLTITKASTTPSYSKAGDPIDYTYTVTNQTAVTLTDVSVVDNLVGADPDDLAPSVTCQSLTTPAGSCSGTTTTLQPGQSATFTATYAATQPDVDAGKITDTATVTGQPASGDPATATSVAVTVTATSSPALMLTKSADPSTVTAIGQTVTYSFLVHNGGNVTVSGIGIDEADFTGTGTLSAIDCPSPTLASDTDETRTATYDVTSADLDAGSVSNTATATGTAPDDSAVTSAASTATVTATQTGALTLAKSADPATVATVGDEVTYSFLVTNTGNVTVSDVAIDEGAFSGSGSLSAIDCPSDTLAAGDDETCTATYDVTQADLDAGSVSNTATATGTAAGSPVSSDPSTAAVTATQNATLTLTKSADTSLVTNAGEQVNYSFLVTNTGNVTVSGVGIDDSDFSGSGVLPAITCPSNTLAAGDHETCTATYTSTAADMDAGMIANTATATAPDSSPVSSAPSTAVVSAAETSSLTLTKSATPTTVSAVGDTITYSFLVTNTGNVTVADVAINEVGFSGNGTLSAISCPSGTLAAGDDVTCTATYHVTQADLDAGSITNAATATATVTIAGPANGTTPVSPASTTEVTATQTPGLTLTKSADPATVTAAGQTVTFDYLVTNTGNVTVTGIGIDEGAFSGSGTLSTPTCPDAELAPNADETCTATYTVTQADLDTGSISNTATATGTAPDTSAVTSAGSTATVTATQNRALTLVKSADPSGADTYHAGQQITYSYVVTNTGNVTVTGLAISEGTFTGSGKISAPSCPDSTLEPGDQEVCTADYVLTQDDIDSGSVDNTATATGTAGGAPLSSPPSTVTTPNTPAPALTLTKIATPTTVSKVGDTISYTYLVSNTGNVTVHDVAIDETDFSGSGSLPAPTCPDATLVPGQDETCTTSYLITQADLDAGTISNTAAATGLDPSGTSVASDPSTATVSVSVSPALTLLKSVTPTSVTAAGTPVTYHFLITNTGNQTLTAISIAEKSFSGSGSLSAITCSGTSLAPGAHETCTATYTITSQDLTAGTVSNTAIATGTAGPAGATMAVDSAASTAHLTAHRSASSADDGSTPNPDSDLASTGVDALGLGGVALALLVTGGLILLAGRRRRRA